MNEELDAMEMSRLIELAKNRELVDSVEFERPRYRVEIGAAKFLLNPDGTREFLIKLLRSQRPNGA